jgi:nitrogen fixation protein FixH
MFQKFHWGHAIILTFCTWVVLMMSFMWRSLHEQTGLVTDQAYEKGQAYEETIARQKLAIQSSKQVAFSFDANSHKLQLKGNALAEGKIFFIRPSDPTLDHEFDFTLNANGEQQLPVPALQSGKWLVKTIWREQSTWFETNQSFYLNPIL